MKNVFRISLMLGIICSTLAFVSCNHSHKNGAGRSASTGEELVIVAHVTIFPEFKDEVLKAFQAVVKGTHTEEGNISYDLYEDVNNPMKFTFIEYWKSQSAIDAHNGSAHFQEFAKIIGDKAHLDVSLMKHKF